VAPPDVVIEHPNRETRRARVTRAAVVALLLVSALLVGVVAAAGWDLLEGARGLTVAFAVLDVALAALVARWRRGVLPIAAAVALVLAIFAAVAGPAWFDRDAPGFAEPALDAGLLGVLCLLLVPVQLLLAALALSGFRQAWHVEVERPAGAPGAPRRPAGRRRLPA